MSAQTITCPVWCVEHAEAGEPVGPLGYREDAATHFRRRQGESMKDGESWAVDLWQIEDNEPAAVYTGATGDAALTADQARAMARALMEAADALDAAS